LAEALDSCMSGKEITSKFITFAEGGSPVKSQTKIDTFLKEAVESSSNCFHVQKDFALADDLWPVDVDASQFRHLIANVSTNACEAMSGEGKLMVSAENVVLDKENNGSLIQNGKYIRIDIKDQGIGISEENLDKIFLPYFTTKKRANVKGLGLGLTVCSSIIKGHKGKITLDSAENEGTTFHIYLPASAAS
jgi:two-component system cell cycle sensor histidine kinase/response regulator CckA